VGWGDKEMSRVDQLETYSTTPETAAARRQFASGDWLWRWFTLTMLVVVAMVMLVPFLWLVSSSLKPQHQVFQFPPQWIPNPILFENYTQALTYKPFDIYLRNSLFIVTLNILAVVLSSSFCAYGFARLSFPGRDLWFGVVLATLMVPYVVLLVPTFVIFTRLGWIDTFLPLIVPQFFGGGAFNIFLMRQFFRTIPDELSDAARIDGASEFGIYWRIILPLSKPALITVAIFTFLGSWNDFLGPIIYLKSPEHFTVAVGLASFRSVLNTRWELQMAASTAMIVPVVVLFFVAQRYFIKGIVMTGLKG
jgi:multiple sugar transport system permease protein